MRWVALALILVVAVLVGVCVATMGNDGEDGVKEEGPAPAVREELTILSHEITRDEWGDPIVTGQAQNTGTAKLTWASIDVKYKDASGAVIDTSLDGIDDLEPSEVWNFRVPYLGTQGDSIASYEISVGTLSTW